VSIEENITKYFCRFCNKEVKKEDIICPNCGSNLEKVGRRREIKQTHTSKLGLSIVEIRGRKKKKGFPGDIIKEIDRNKISGETKRPTKEQLIIDRSNINKTVKKHYVKEWDKDKKKWITVHNEKEEFNAKRRPKC